MSALICPAGSSSSCSTHLAMQQAKAFEWHEFAVGGLAISELLLTGIVIVLGRQWKGTRTGSCLDPRARFFAYEASLLLLLSVTANICLILWRLVRAPDALGNKAELIITAVAFGVLWYTDILCIREPVRRRRKIADHLARFPTFRFGKSGYNTPVSAPLRHAEFVVRSAWWKLHDEARRRLDEGPQDFWRGKVARCYELATARGGTGGAIVVLHDAATQDDAGTGLLTPEFSHAPELKKQFVANVIWKTALRCGVWNIQAWESGFAAEIVNVLGSVRAVNGMRNGELWHNVPDNDKIKGCPDQGMDDRLSAAVALELCTLLWAALAVEVFDYLGTGRRMILLPAFVNVPQTTKEDENWTTATLLGACVSLRDALT